MKLLVIGATGPAGREIVNQAVTAGHRVTALVRDPAKADSAPAFKKATGNVLEPATLETALAGQEAVTSSLGSAASGPFKEMTLLSEGTRNLVAAMKSQGVSRLICITGVGAGDSKGHGPWYGHIFLEEGGGLRQEKAAPGTDGQHRNQGGSNRIKPLRWGGKPKILKKLKSKREAKAEMKRCAVHLNFGGRPSFERRGLGKRRFAAIPSPSPNQTESNRIKPNQAGSNLAPDAHIQLLRIVKVT